MSDNNVLGLARRLVAKIVLRHHKILAATRSQAVVHIAARPTRNERISSTDERAIVLQSHHGRRRLHLSSRVGLRIHEFFGNRHVGVALRRLQRFFHRRQPIASCQRRESNHSEIVSIPQADRRDL